MTGRRGIRSKQLLDELKETRGYWKLNEEALDRTLCGELALEESVDLPLDCGINEILSTNLSHGRGNKNPWAL